MRLIDTSLPDCLLFEPRLCSDARGFFFEAWSQSAFAARGLSPIWIQGNVSSSAQGVLRGLHYQWPGPQGKLVSVLAGKVLDVTVDLRVGSPHFGRWAAEELSSENCRSLWIPPGFAHGFTVLSEQALFSYLVTAPYNPAAEVRVRWNDPALGIAWRATAPILSANDAAAPTLADLPADKLPVLEQCAPC